MWWVCVCGIECGRSVRRRCITHMYMYRSQSHSQHQVYTVQFTNSTMRALNVTASIQHNGACTQQWRISSVIGYVWETIVRKHTHSGDPARTHTQPRYGHDKTRAVITHNSYVQSLKCWAGSGCCCVFECVCVSSVSSELGGVLLLWWPCPTIIHTNRM